MGNWIVIDGGLVSSRFADEVEAREHKAGLIKVTDRAIKTAEGVLQDLRDDLYDFENLIVKRGGC